MIHQHKCLGCNTVVEHDDPSCLVRQGICHLCVKRFQNVPPTPMVEPQKAQMKVFRRRRRVCSNCARSQRPI